MKPKEFFQRWGKGIAEITPLQMLKINLVSYLFILGGLLVGIVTTIITHTWWLVAVLGGGLFVSGTAYLGMLQKYRMLKSIKLRVEAVKNV